MGDTNIFLARCSKCNRQQQVISRGKKPTGSRTCFFCHKNFTLNNKTIIRKLR